MRVGDDIALYIGVRPLPQQPINKLLPELHADLFSRHASPLEVCGLWRSTKEVKRLCPTSFDATENSKEGGVVADVYSSQTGLRTKSKGNTNILLLLHGSPNEFTFFVRGISERRPTNTTHQHFSVKLCASLQNPCEVGGWAVGIGCLLYTSPSPRD